MKKVLHRALLKMAGVVGLVVAVAAMSVVKVFHQEGRKSSSNGMPVICLNGA